MRISDWSSDVCSSDLKAYNASDSNTLSRAVRAGVTCAGPVTDAMPGLDNAATAIAPALVSGAGYVMHTRNVSHKQIDAALAQLERKQNPESSALELKGVTAEQYARLMATKAPLDDALEPIID